jgi:hypothetical protein
MSSTEHVLKAYEDQGVCARLPVFDKNAWRAMTRGDSPVPTCKADVKAAIAKIKSGPPMPLRSRMTRAAAGLEAAELGSAPADAPQAGGADALRRETSLVCRNDEIALVNLGLGNPELSAADREELLHDLDGETPAFEGFKETDHFTFRWTTRSTEPLHNLADVGTVDRAAATLERAYTFFEAEFGRPPYKIAPTAKIDVVFRHVPEGAARADPPDGPILFNATAWTADPDAVEPTAAHELFHKLQYAFGYRSRHLPSSADAWFFEGTAGLAEIFLCDRVSIAAKISRTFESPKQALRSLGYSTLPFWLFGCNACTPPASAARAMFEAYEGSGRPRDTLDAFVDFVSGRSTLPSDTYEFFLEFSEARLKKSLWRTPLIDSRGAPIALDVAPDGRFDLAPGDARPLTASVSDLACHHFHFTPASGAGASRMRIVPAPTNRDMLGRVFVRKSDGLTTTHAISFSSESVVDLDHAVGAVVMLVSGSPRAFYEIEVRGE